ncbi:hypothetical protein HGRIS_004019 [Hohenbuehelia grisea]|uniref:Uncharacterized protein n=1 Tax=Hohenbuehelia grisea TaxID=104357 RepID=A0ABR3JHK0_9AGAR
MALEVRPLVAVVDRIDGDLARLEKPPSLRRMATASLRSVDRVAQTVRHECLVHATIPRSQRSQRLKAGSRHRVDRAWENAEMGGNTPPSEDPTSTRILRHKRAGLQDMSEGQGGLQACMGESACSSAGRANIDGVAELRGSA